MLVEAKVIKGGSRCQETLEEGIEEDSSLRLVKEIKPAGPRKGENRSQDPGNGWPKGGGTLKSLLPGKESKDRRPDSGNFP